MAFRILSLGEILFDVYPDYRRLGGAPFNFAYHLHNFGAQVAFASRIGDDENGREILNTLEARQFPRDQLQIDSDHPTGTVRVELDEKGVPDFTITETVAYDFIDDEPVIETVIRSGGVDLIYFGTLAQRHSVSRTAIHNILEAAPEETLVLYDINLRQSFYSANILEMSLSRSDIVKLNESELHMLQTMFKLDQASEVASHQLLERFGIQYLCVTKGEQGSVVYVDGQKVVWQNTEPAGGEVVDTVGAGDAYASVLAYGILNGWPARQIAVAASKFAAAVCTISGAVPDDAGFYQKHKPGNHHG